MTTQRRVVEIPLDLIDDTDRLRPVDPSYALLLAESIEERGLGTPIQVAEPDAAGRHRLLAGAHRLAAFRVLGLRAIPALVVAADEIEARLIEIDENLMRRELSAFERGRFLAERKRLHEARDGARRGGDRKSSRYQSDKLANWSQRFTAEAAARTGLSEREVQRAIARYAGLAETIRDRIAGTWLAENGRALDALRKLPPAQQRAVLDDLFAEGGAHEDLNGAIRRAAGRQAPPALEAFDRFVALWRHMDRRTRERVRAFINQDKGDDL